MDKMSAEERADFETSLDMIFQYYGLEDISDQFDSSIKKDLLAAHNDREAQARKEALLQAATLMRRLWATGTDTNDIAHEVANAIEALDVEGVDELKRYKKVVEAAQELSAEIDPRTELFMDDLLRLEKMRSALKELEEGAENE